MKKSVARKASADLTVRAETTADLMMRDPMSIRDDASVEEVIALLTDTGMTAVSVIDEGGQPVGVVSRTDILVHDRQKAGSLVAAAGSRERGGPKRTPRDRLPGGLVAERAESVQVRDIMTPVVFAVPEETPIAKVVEEMLALKVQQLFVVGRDGVLVGIISALDVLRHLRAPRGAAGDG